MIAPEEIQAGLEEMVAQNLDATEDELVAGVARALGFKSTSAGLRKTVAEALALSLTSGRLERNHQLIVLKTQGA